MGRSPDCFTGVHLDGNTVRANSWNGQLVTLDRETGQVLSVEFWRAAGTLAGRLARTVAGAAKAITKAADQQQLIGDAITAIQARSSGFIVITEDADFDILARS